MTKETAQKPSKAKLVDYIIIAVIAALVGYAAIVASGDEPASELVGKEAPAFKLKSASGEVVGPGDYAGKVVLLDFWATWCGPCREQMPALAELERDANLRDTLVVLSINTDDPSSEREELIQEFLETNNLEIDVLYDNGFVSRQYSVTRIPTIVVVAPDGTITYAASGLKSERKLRKLVEEAASKTPDT